jgi:hypothetical protein
MRSPSDEEVVMNALDRDWLVRLMQDEQIPKTFSWESRRPAGRWSSRS